MLLSVAQIVKIAAESLPVLYGIYTVPLPIVKMQKRKSNQPTYEFKWYTSKSGIWTASCQTCRFIASETLPILYGEKTFEFMRYTNNDANEFCKLIGSNKLFVNKAILAVIQHKHISEYDCDEID